VGNFIISCTTEFSPIFLFHSFHSSIPPTTHSPRQPALPAMDAPEPSKYITLVSADGFEFVVLREAALVSPFIKRMLDPRSA
jgi:hypothetical protein